MSKPKQDGSARFSFFFTLREMLSIRFKALGWRALPAVLAALAQGLVWCFGVSAMQILFDAAAEAASAPGSGYAGVIRGFLRMGGVMLAEIILNNLAGYLGDTHDIIFSRALKARMNSAAALTDPVAYEDTGHLADIEKAKDAVGYRASGFTWGFVELFAFYLPFFVFMTIYLYKLRPALPLLFAMIAAPVVLEQIIRARIMAATENLAAPLRREFDHYENALCAREYLKETRLLGASGFFFNKYRQTLKKLNAAAWKAQGKVRLYDLLFRFPTVASHIGIILLLVYSLRDGYIGVGAFAAVLASIDRLFDVIYGLFQWGYFSNLAENLAFSRNLVAFFHLPKRTGTRELRSGPHGVSLRDVSFSYPGRAEAALKGVSLDIAPGETVALVGGNGAGKSTLVKLVTGLFLPGGGSVLIDGEDTRGLSMPSLFAGASGVFQRYQKYKLAARDNISISDLGRPVDDGACEAAAGRAGVELNSDAYPQGLDTMLSKEFGGVDLSGGQWQRLAIARGLYRANDFIVLDEPTAAIDPIEERHIYRSFMELAKGKTAVLVTHRLGATRIADRILVMDGGLLVEEGSHESLMAKNGVYAEMFRSQAQWYEDGGSGKEAL